jgi:hypothetical protein
MNIIYKKCCLEVFSMNPNIINPVINPAPFENIPGPNVASVTKGDNFDMCKLQYYNPQPIVGARLAHAYVPFQCLNCLYPPDIGLKQGTIFPELDRPYGADPAFTYDG